MSEPTSKHKEESAVQQARLALCIGVKNVIFNVLTMFKITVPEKM
jgi:arginyl-tRNA synthetase